MNYRDFQGINALGRIATDDEGNLYKWTKFNGFKWKPAGSDCWDFYPKPYATIPRLRWV